MGNIVVGIIFIIGGATGNLALKGTGSSGAIMVVGFLLAAYGGFTLMRGQNR
jgi:hypothetical protein